MKRLSFLFAIVVALSAVFAVGCANKKSARSCYDLSLSYEDGVLDGSLDFTFYNATDTAVKELKFNIYPNAYREGAKYTPVAASDGAGAYYAGKSYGGIEIESVAVKNEAAAYEIGGEDENILIVPLGAEIFPGERCALAIDFTVRLAKINHRLGITQGGTVNLANFYPVLCGYDNGFYECVYYSAGDPFFSECADYNVRFTADEKYVVASSGVVAASSTENGKTTYTYRLKNARDFALALNENFETMSAKAGDVTVSYYYVKDASPVRSMDFAVKAVTTFSDMFGAYPYDTLSVVETGFNEGGMEYPALVYISDRLDEASYGEVIVHETAHQWWYASVGNNEIESPFLDEGLAEYSVVLFYEANEGLGMTRPQMIEAAEMTYRTYCNVYDQLFGKVDTTMLRPLGEYSSEYEYVNIAYIKSCLMFEHLRVGIGDGMFFKGLKRYYADNAYSVARPEDLVGAFEKCGADTNGFFESFFDGSAII